MGDRCCSTLICAERDKDVFEKMGYRLEESQALPADGNEIPGLQWLVSGCLRRSPPCFGRQGMALLRSST